MLPYLALHLDRRTRLVARGCCRCEVEGACSLRFGLVPMLSEYGWGRQEDWRGSPEAEAAALRSRGAPREEGEGEEGA